MMEYKDASHWENADFGPLPPAKNPQAIRIEKHQQAKAAAAYQRAKENQRPFDDFDSSSQQESNFDKFDALDNSF